MPLSSAELIHDPIVAVTVTETDYDRSTARFLAHPAFSRLKIVQGRDPHYS